MLSQRHGKSDVQGMLVDFLLAAMAAHQVLSAAEGLTV